MSAMGASRNRLIAGRDEPIRLQVRTNVAIAYDPLISTGALAGLC
jgi:hypothetical protein